MWYPYGKYMGSTWETCVMDSKLQSKLGIKNNCSLSFSPWTWSFDLRCDFHFSVLLYCLSLLLFLLQACSWCKKQKAKSKNGRKTGATAGCELKACQKTFHFYCAKLHAVTSRRKSRNNLDVYRYVVIWCISQIPFIGVTCSVIKSDVGGMCENCILFFCLSHPKVTLCGWWYVIV